ncbi:hypothetical protein AB6A40_006276 [Gnathostoma spinigerum]|uniref:Uncharacterized protein n=1 Tax=Gnathostoma spinigerum TaxID=75299 RepID=A0ABD6ESP9_9BILA
MCMLTWKKPNKTVPWKDILQPKVVLISNTASGNQQVQDASVIPLIAIVDVNRCCRQNEPPIAEFVLSAADETQMETLSKTKANLEDIKTSKHLQTKLETGKGIDTLKSTSSSANGCLNVNQPQNFLDFMNIVLQQPWQNIAIFVLVFILIISVKSKA